MKPGLSDANIRLISTMLFNQSFFIANNLVPLTCQLSDCLTLCLFWGSVKAEEYSENPILIVHQQCWLLPSLSFGTDLWGRSSLHWPWGAGPALLALPCTQT